MYKELNAIIEQDPTSEEFDSQRVRVAIYNDTPNTSFENLLHTSKMTLCTYIVMLHEDEPSDWVHNISSKVAISICLEGNGTLPQSFLHNSFVPF